MFVVVHAMLRTARLNFDLRGTQQLYNPIMSLARRSLTHGIIISHSGTFNDYEPCIMSLDSWAMEFHRVATLAHHVVPPTDMNCSCCGMPFRYYQWGNHKLMFAGVADGTVRLLAATQESDYIGEESHNDTDDIDCGRLAT